MGKSDPNAYIRVKGKTNFFTTDSLQGKMKSLAAIEKQKKVIKTTFRNVQKKQKHSMNFFLELLPHQNIFNKQNVFGNFTF